MKKFTLIFVGLVLFSCQSQNTDSFKQIASFPKKLQEISGIVYLASQDNIFTIQDSGNKNEIYKIDLNGKLIQTLTVTNATNIDWEDITKDDSGNLYIGDFGNNKNERKDLCIYKVDSNELNNSSANYSYKISFSYPEQLSFPPDKKELFFDVEGFFELNNFFYLFTKNRSKQFDGTTYIYKIKNAPGKQDAIKVGEFKTCSNYNHCVITSAAISKSKNKIALLSHDKVLLYTNFQSDNFLSGNVTQIELDHFSQKESITFKDEHTLLIADEKSKKIGGNLYQLSLP